MSSKVSDDNRLALGEYNLQRWGVVIGQTHVPDLRVTLNNGLFKFKENKLSFVNLSIKF